MLKKIHSLVKGQGHLVLATCGDLGPHASLMAFAAELGQGEHGTAASEVGGEFWLATLAETRKFANLRENPRASLLLDDRGDGPDGPGLALTVSAEARPFASPAAEQAARAALLARHPALADFLALPGVVVLRLVGLRYQLLSGLTETFLWEPTKNP